MTVEERLSEARVRRPSVDVSDALGRVRSVHRRRRRMRGSAAVLAVAGATMAAIVVGIGSADDRSTDVATGVSQPSDEPAVPGVSPDSPALELPEGWSEMRGSPLSARVGSAGVATDEEFVVWGGRAAEPLGDGAAYDFRTDEWTSMTESPLPPQAGSVAVWTGTEVVFWGGIGDGGTTVDGVAAAAWNPASNEWRVVPNELDLGASRPLTGAVWTGTEIILVGVSGPANAFLASDAFAVDPTSGELRPLEPIPRPASPEYRPRGRAAFVVGEELLLVTVADGFPVTIDRLDIATGRWGPTVETNMPGINASSDAAAWTGERLVIANHHLGPGSVFNPTNSEIEEIPSSYSVHRFPAVAVTEELVSVGDRYFDLATMRWSDAETIPDPVRASPISVGSAGAMYVWGGDACGPGASCTDIVDPGPGLIWVPPGQR